MKAIDLSKQEVFAFALIVPDAFQRVKFRFSESQEQGQTLEAPLLYDPETRSIHFDFSYSDKEILQLHCQQNGLEFLGHFSEEDVISRGEEWITNEIWQTLHPN